MIQKLYGSFKGDAFDKRVLPFFHECNDVYLGVLLIGLRGMPWNASAVELDLRHRKRRYRAGNVMCCQRCRSLAP